MLLTDYIPAGIAILLAVGFCVVLSILAIVLGPKKVNPVKLSPFECGSDPIGSPHIHFSSRFYQIAILFVVFDIEIAFMYPWALNYRRLSTLGVWFGWFEMFAFSAVLAIALIYMWKRGAIAWE